MGNKWSKMCETQLQIDMNKATHQWVIATAVAIRIHPTARCSRKWTRSPVRASQLSVSSHFACVVIFYLIVRLHEEGWYRDVIGC